MATAADPETTFKLASDTEIVIQRRFDAEPALVFRAHTDPKLVARWWGPRGFETLVEKMEVRPGGSWRFAQKGPDGAEHAFHGEYLEVVPDRGLTRTSEYEGMPGHVLEETATFEPEGGGTLLTLSVRFAGRQDRDGMLRSGMEPGARQSLERLEESLAGLAGREFVIERVFDAPRELVFKAWTDPGHLARWFGPKGAAVKHAKADLRPGGVLHTRMATSDGGEMWGKMAYREINPPSRLVYLNSFSDEAGGLTRHPMSPTWPLEMLTTVTFTPEGAGTRITLQWAPFRATAQERAAFDAAFDSMTGGWTGSFDQLDEYLTHMKGGAR